MRKLYVLLCALFAGAAGRTQTTLVNSNFETGDATVWSFANGATNAWVVGTATANGGVKSAYVSNDGGVSNAYTPSVTTVSHLYTPVSFPAGQGAIILRFDAKGIGEHSTSVFDYVRVSSTAAAPVAGSLPAVADQLPVFVSAQTNFATFWVALPSSYAGTTRNLVFSFRCGGTVGGASFAIDNVKLTSAVVAGLTGTKTIKAAGGTYASFGEAIANLNANGVGASPLTVNVDAGLTLNETPTAITTSGTSSATVLFQKSGGGANPRIVATGSGNSRTTSTGTIATNTDAVLALAGADYITFDGIDFASADYVAGTSAIEYGVYVYNASATGGAQFNTIRNSTITLNRANTASVGILQDDAVTPTAATGANSNNKYHNLTISNAAAGIWLSGNASFPDLNTEVGTTSCTVFNTIGDPGVSDDIGNGANQAWGIRATNQGTAKIFNNKISNVTSTSATLGADGIFIETFQNAANEVSNNIITGISIDNSTSTATASGIRLSHPTSGTHSIRVYNNSISGITHAYTGTATLNRYIKGIFISGVSGANTETYYFDFNSVRIDGSASPNTSSAALEISTTSGPVCLYRNNVLANFTGAQGATARHYAFVSTSGSNVGNGSSAMTYNDLYVPNDVGNSGYLGRGNLNNYPNLTSFQSNFTTATNNLSINPGFVSATDLHANASGLNAAADPAYKTNSSWVTTDFDCQTRATAADIGADEFTPASADCAAPSNPTTLTFTNASTSSATGSFTAPASAPTGYLVVRSSTTLNANPVNGTSYIVGNTIGNGTVVYAGGGTSFDLAGLSANTAYILTVFAYNSANCLNGPVYNTASPLSGTVTTCPPTPGSPTVIAQSASGFQLSFASSKGGGAGAVTYSLEVATDAGFANLAGGSAISFADTTTTQGTMYYSVSGLSAATTYYYRLKAVGCNTATVSGSTTTLCAAASVPYTESFESISAANTLPVCMSASPTVAAGGKTQTYIAPATGTNVALSARTGSKFGAVYFSPSNTAGYFFTAPLQLTAGVTYTASVWYKTDGVAWTDAGIYYGTAATAAAMTNTVASVSNASATSYTQITGTFTPSASGVYYVGIRGFNATVNANYIAFDDISVTAVQSCTAPVMTATTAITYNSATLNWNAPVPAPASYEVYYSTSPTAPTNATAATATGITATSWSVSGLAASTTYYAWVRSNCGATGASNWSATGVSFTTLCAPVNAPYTENFDAATVPALPSCTSGEDANGDGSTWVTANAPTGYTGKTLQYGFNANNAANDWFYTRGLNLTAGTSYTLSFKYGNNSNLYAEKMRVYYGGTPAAASQTNLLFDDAAISGGTVKTANISFTPPSNGVYYIGFNAYSLADQNTLYLDDIALDVTAGCATPLNVSVGSVTATSASVGWTGTGSFILEYGPSGFTPGTAASAGTNGTVINPATSPQSISNLTAGRAYDVYVRKNCTSTGGGYSANSTKVSFATLPTNDEPANAVPLTQTAYNAACSTALYTTVGATPSTPSSACFTTAQDDDVWFSFNATNSKAILKVSNYTNASGTAGSLQYGLYTGSVASLSEVDCEASALVTTTSTGGEIAIRKTLTVGQTYYVRLLTGGTGGRANFNLCVMTPDVAANTSANTCVTVMPVTINSANGNNNVWVPVYTTDGKLVAEINAKGNNLGAITTKVYRNTNAIRTDNAGKAYMDRNVEITPTTQPATPVSIRLYFTATEFTALRNKAGSQVNAIGDLSVFKNNQACGARVNGAAYPLSTSGSVYENNYFVAGDISAFSSFFIASNAYSVLPANLLTFSGIRQGAGNLLKWTVAQEQNIVSYEVERSENGSVWNLLGTVNSFGNTAAQRSYNFTDNNVAGLKQYYRLRQVDRNGAVRLSNVILISATKASVLTLSGLFPNPAASKLNVLVDAPAKDNITVLVMDAVGRVVKTQKAAVEVGANTLQLDVTGLSQGAYLVKLVCEADCQTAAKSFVKE